MAIMLLFVKQFSEPHVADSLQLRNAQCASKNVVTASLFRLPFVHIGMTVLLNES